MQFLVPPGQKESEGDQTGRTFEQVIDIYNSMIKRLDVVLFTYDVGNLESFHDLTYWVDGVGRLMNDATGYLFKATSINQYPALRVIRKEGSEILHYVEGLTSTFTTYLSWPSGLVSSGTLSLEWRDSPEGDWNLDPNSFNYYTTNVQRIYESPNARDYRLTSAETIDESIVAYLTVYKPAPIDLASYEIEEMYLVTLSPNSMGIWIKTDQGLSYTLQKSSDLSSWTDVDSSFEGSDSLEFLDIATDPESTGFYRFVVRNSN